MAILETKDTSSIGPQWPPKESSFNRIKGIDNRGIITSNDKFLQTIDETRSIIEKEIDNTQNTECKIDRVSIRAVVNNGIWFDNLSSFKDLAEVIIPLNGTHGSFENSSIIYLGRNSTTRKSDEGDLNRAISNVNEAIQKSEVSLSGAIQRAEEQGFELSVLNLSERMASTVIQGQMAHLYERFGWNSDDVLDILGKSSNVIAVAKSGNEIVSAGIAEMSTVNFLDLNTLRMAEITEAATSENHQKKGLYSAVAAKLMLELVNLSQINGVDGGKIDIVFGECNGNEPGVLKAVKSLGRTFSYEIVQKGNLPFKGFLPQHVPIAGAERKTPYNDLFPAFISYKRLLEISGK